MKGIREIIEQIVRQEIRSALVDSEDIVKEAVKTLLLPELRAATRDAISRVVEDMVKEAPKIEETSPLSASITPQESAGIQETELVAPPEAEISASSEVGACPKRDNDGKYLYCVAEGSERISLGKIGIEGNEVYTIPYKDFCAVVHNCPAEPYKSEDNEVVKSWIMAHQKVVNIAWEKFGTVLPLGFDTIIQGNEDTDPDENMKNWLREDYESLREKMEKVRGKEEYGVQVFWDPKVIAHKIVQRNEEIQKLEKEMKSKPKGAAYMYKQKLEGAIKKEMEAKADQYFKDFYNQTKKHVDDLRVEKTKEIDKDKQMLMNLSCLVCKDKSKELGEELEKINKMEGFSVRFTGPWPPYSFT